MIIIGLLVLIAAVVFGLELVFQNHHHTAAIKVFGQGLGLHNQAALFILGVIVGAAVIFALALIMSGVRHKGSKAAARRAQRRESRRTRGQRDDLVIENERLRDELADRQGAGTSLEGGEAGASAEPGARTSQL